MKKFISDFKSFMNKGNIVELAIAVVVGGAFSKIVSSFVANIINPIIGLIIGRIHLDDLKVVLRAADETAGITELALSYGVFLQALVDFIIIALCIFVALRILKRLTSEAKKQAKETREQLKRLRSKDQEAQDDTAPEAALVSPDPIVEQAPINTSEAPPQPAIAPTELGLLQEIRDLLKQQSDKE